MSKKKHKSKHRPVFTKPPELDEMYDSVPPPINPVNGFAKSANKNSEGYQFYRKIRDFLPEWWEEFNGDLDKDGRLKYNTLKKFIASKTTRRKEQIWLHAMCGSATIHDNHTDVPWLGDWENRRKTGYGVLDDPQKIKLLAKAIKNNVAATEAVRAITPVLMDNLVYYSNLEKQVHEAFVGRAFLGGKANSLENQSRFRMYKGMLKSCLKLKLRAIRGIMRLHGVNPEQPEVMRDMAQIAGGIGAAAALTGIAAGQRIPGLGTAVPAPGGGTQIAAFTYDAMLLAQQLTRHAHTFKRPLPATIEGETTGKPQDEEEESSKTNGHERHGRPQ